MNNLEKIVPPLELCKQIPAGEFEDSALVWVYDDVAGFLCRTSGCEQIHKKEWQLEHNHPRKIAIRRKSGHEIYPAPTLAEIQRELQNLSIFIIDGDITVSCKINPEDTISETARDANDVTAAALRIWLKLKGIEVKNKNLSR